MSLVVIALALATSAAPADAAPPPGLLFGFYRMIAFRDMANSLGCQGGEKAQADAEFVAIRKRLIARYGKRPFSPPRQRVAPRGDCFTAISVYRVNLADYRREVDAALANGRLQQ
jgi:hypothetical protein